MVVLGIAHLGSAGHLAGWLQCHASSIVFPMLLEFTDGLKGWYGKRHLCGVLALGHKMQSNGKIDSMQAFNTNKCKLQTKAMTISGNPKAQCQLWMVDAMHDEALRADVHVKAFYADMKACTQAHFFHHMKLPKSRQQKKFTLPLLVLLPSWPFSFHRSP